MMNIMDGDPEDPGQKLVTVAEDLSTVRFSAIEDLSFSDLPKKQRPHLTLYIDSTNPIPNQEVRHLLSSVNWMDLVIEVDIHENPDRLKHLASIVETPSAPFFFFHGKTIGGREQLMRLLKGNGHKSGFQKLYTMYMEWVNSNYSYRIGSDYGFHRKIDRHLLLNMNLQVRDKLSNPKLAHGTSRILPKICLADKTLEIEKILSDILLHFSFANVRSLEVDGHVHRRCFNGRSLSNFFRSSYRISDGESIHICQQLFDFLILRQVERRDLCLFQDSNHLYRFYTHDNPVILNKLLAFPRRRADGFVDAFALVKNLHQKMAALYGKCTARSEGGQDQTDIRDAFYNRDFMDCRVAACELQHVTSLIKREECGLHTSTPYASSFAGLGHSAEKTSPEQEVDERRFYISTSGHPSCISKEKGYFIQGDKPPDTCTCPLVTTVYEQSYLKAFFINLFNLGVLQAFVQVGVPNAPPNRIPNTFYTKVSYLIGNSEISLAQIQYGCLKCTCKWDMKEGVESLPMDWAWTLEKKDPRVLFVLQDSQKYVPRSLFFEPLTIETELDYWAQQFINDCKNVSVDIPESLFEMVGITTPLWTTPPTSKKEGFSRKSNSDMERVTVHLSCIFESYETDFGKNKLEMLSFIKHYLLGEKHKAMERVLQAHHEGLMLLVIKYFPLVWNPHGQLNLTCCGCFPFTEERRRK